MARNPWRAGDPLFRGDDAESPGVPDPESKRSVVAHILYLGGRGRSTPFSSTTESEEVARYFAGAAGVVWETTPAEARREGARHIPRKQLLQDLRGFGRGKVKWNDAWEVAQAANYVEQWSEHLLDWSLAPPERVVSALARSFRRKT